VLADGIHQIVQWRIDELEARLERGRDDVVDGDFAYTWGFIFAAGRILSGERLIFFDESAESFAECGFCHGAVSVGESFGEGKRILVNA
jgi:hypothetical protein